MRRLSFIIFLISISYYMCYNIIVNILFFGADGIGVSLSGVDRQWNMHVFRYNMLKRMSDGIVWLDEHLSKKKPKYSVL